MSDQVLMGRLSVREFVAPLIKTGSLEYGVGGLGMARGVELHQRIQARRRKRDSDYQCEVTIEREFQLDDVHVSLGGRIDGLWGRTTRVLEEIKTTSSIARLLDALNDAEHPYRLQIQVYGYLTYLEHGHVPECHLLLVSAYDEQELDLTVELDPVGFELWFQKRLQAWRERILQAAQRARLRTAIGSRLEFPFPNYRRGQGELRDLVSAAAANDAPLLVQAPTGMGKTMAVLEPLTRQALMANRRVIYVTPKNSQHSIPLEAVRLLRQRDHDLSVSTISSREKACLNDDVICDARHCVFADGYYDKSHQHSAHERMSNDRVLDGTSYREWGSQLEMCPYELALEVSQQVDLVVCDYNYLISPTGSLFDGTERPTRDHLVIDEAHNLPERVRDQLTRSLTLSQVNELRALSFDHARAAAILTSIEGLMRDQIRRHGPTFCETETDMAAFEGLLTEANLMLAEFMASGKAASLEHPVFQLYFLLTRFVTALTSMDEGFRLVFQGKGDPALRVICCDPGPFLRKRFKQFGAVIAMSATLKPFDFFARSLGLEGKRLKVHEFTGVFPAENRKVVIVPQVNTLYRQRDRQAPRAAELIQRVVASRKGNYLVFSPSFAFSKSVSDHLQLARFRVFTQTPGMRPKEVAALCAKLRQKTKNVVILAVQGGSLAEGLDFPGDDLSGAFVLGPGLPAYTEERELLRRYYQEQGLDGFSFAYVYPGMARSVQAAGRVIRTETDCGLVILADHRFLTRPYSDALPADWFEESVGELVSESILTDVAAFWRCHPRSKA